MICCGGEEIDRDAGFDGPGEFVPFAPGLGAVDVLSFFQAAALDQRLDNDIGGINLNLFAEQVLRVRNVSVLRDVEDFDVAHFGFLAAQAAGYFNARADGLECFDDSFRNDAGAIGGMFDLVAHCSNSWFLPLDPTPLRISVSRPAIKPRRRASAASRSGVESVFVGLPKVLVR